MSSQRISRGFHRLTLFLTVAAVAFFSTRAGAVFQTYSQWRAHSVDARAQYIAGAVDSLTLFSDNSEGAATSMHYAVCLSNSKMTAVQLAGNLSAFVDARPELHAQPVQVGLIQYLVQVCGKPPS
jgi:hypothetical protein